MTNKHIFKQERIGQNKTSLISSFMISDFKIPSFMIPQFQLVYPHWCPPISLWGRMKTANHAWEWCHPISLWGRMKTANHAWEWCHPISLWGRMKTVNHAWECWKSKWNGTSKFELAKEFHSIRRNPHPDLEPATSRKVEKGSKLTSIKSEKAR